MRNIIQFVVLVATLFALQVVPQQSFAGEEKAILVTGASTGIGRHLAEALAAEGYHVYAGARKDKDLAELDAIENITAVRLDVTKQDQVDAAVANVRAHGVVLNSLETNSGLGRGDFLAETPIHHQS